MGQITHPQQEILDLIDQDFPKDQIVDMIIDGDVYQYGQMNDGRFLRGTPEGRYIMRYWDVLLVKEGLDHTQFGFGEKMFQGHHPDGDVQNDKDVISMDVSEHISMHNKQWWATMTADEYATACQAHAEGQANMSPEAKRIKNENISKGHMKYRATLTINRQIELDKAISRGKGGHPDEVEKFLDAFSVLGIHFTLADFIRDTGYSAKSGQKVLYRLYDTGRVLSSKDPHDGRMRLYKVI